MYKLLCALVGFFMISFTVSVGTGGTVSAADAGVTAGVDTVYVNGEVLTMNASNDIAQAVAVKGDKIHAVGSNSDIRALIGPNTRVVDLAGKTLLPGFIDAHGHFPESGVNALYRVNANSPPLDTTQSIPTSSPVCARKPRRHPRANGSRGSVMTIPCWRRRGIPPGMIWIRLAPSIPSGCLISPGILA
jgi:hypothetical protein